MIIGIMSDTHDRLDTLKRAVAFFNAHAVSAVLHAGDFVAPFAFKALHGLSSPVISVFGNNDGEREGLKNSLRPGDTLKNGPYAFELGGRRFLLMHELRRQERGTGAGRCEIMVYGHAHKREYDPGPPVMINPGECCGWLTGEATVALLDSETLAVSFHTL